jgi:protein phosphatase
VLLCGPAACGKSTLARRIARPTQIVSSDRCRALVGDDESNQTLSPRAFDLFHRIIAHRLALGRFTVADSTAISPDARRELRRLARRARRPVVLLAFETPLTVCLARNAARRRQVPPDVLRAQHARFRAQRRRFQVEGYHAVLRLDLDAAASFSLRASARRRRRAAVGVRRP